MAHIHKLPGLIWSVPVLFPFHLSPSPPIPRRRVSPFPSVTIVGECFRSGLFPSSEIVTVVVAGDRGIVCRRQIPSPPLFFPGVPILIRFPFSFPSAPVVGECSAPIKTLAAPIRRSRWSPGTAPPKNTPRRPHSPVPVGHSSPQRPRSLRSLADLRLPLVAVRSRVSSPRPRSFARRRRRSASLHCAARSRSACGAPTAPSRGPQRPSPLPSRNTNGVRPSIVILVKIG